MSEWKAKRFWKSATAETVEDGWAVHLDGRAVRTPAKAILTLPTHALAADIAAEWDAQTDVIDPGTMPLTRAANSAIDKVIPQRAAIIDMLAEYGDTDLLCYRAEKPEELITRQAQGWDPLLEWAAQTFGVRFAVAAGVMHVAQSAQVSSAMKAALNEADPFALTALHDLIMLSGSLVLALAVVHGRLSVEDAWDLSRIDENWQQEKWGADAEEAKVVQGKRTQFLNAKALFDLSRR